MSVSSRRFIPAAGHDLALPLYDPLTKLLGAERARCALVAQAGLRAGHRVLDVGCGTGSLIIRAKRDHPGVTFVGIDPDPKALARCEKKAERRGLTARFDRGYADALPYDGASFDRVLSSFVLHHLDAGEIRAALGEALRVLVPGGSLHLVDLAMPHGHHSPRFFLGGARMRADRHGSIVELLLDVGFTEAREVEHRRSLLQTVVYYRGTALR